MKTIYVANCIEAGERFISTFQTKETNKEKLLAMGQGLAGEWGGECISVRKWRPIQYAQVWDMKKGEWVKATKKSWHNFILKNPKSNRYDYSKIVYFNEEPSQDKHIWDCDLTDDQNLKLSKDPEVKKILAETKTK